MIRSRIFHTSNEKNKAKNLTTWSNVIRKESKQAVFFTTTIVNIHFWLGEKGRNERRVIQSQWKIDQLYSDYEWVTLVWRELTSELIRCFTFWKVVIWILHHMNNPTTKVFNSNTNKEEEEEITLERDKHAKNDYWLWYHPCPLTLVLPK